MVEESEDKVQAKQELKDKVFKCICMQYFLSVVAHTMNLQSEAILLRNACGGNLGKAARLGSMSNAVANVLGVLLNQIGGKLSDSIGRKPFFVIGPVVQAMTGLVVFTKPNNAMVLATCRAMRAMATTFSGTVIGGAGMRDTFQGKEYAIKASKAGSVVGLAIMVGPAIESLILKRVKPGSEFVSYLGLAVLGLIAALNPVPETLTDEKKTRFDLRAGLQSANPLGFLTLYTHGSVAVKKLVTITSLQTMIDGKNMTDLTQIWTREHLKLQMETIRNFVMGYGFSSLLASRHLVPFLLKNMSVSGYTSLTNFTNFLGFAMRGSVESVWVFFGALPFMLPGVNGASTAALGPVNNEHMNACGFGIGESSAWVNNLRVLVSAWATLMYGYFYGWLRKRRLNVGLTFTLAGCFGAALPQLMLMLLVNKSELEPRRKSLS